MALLPLIQLPDGVSPRSTLFWGQAEVVQTVLGVLVLTVSGSTGGLWKGLVHICRCELVLGWWRSTWEGVLSGGGAKKKMSFKLWLPQSSDGGSYRKT